MDLTMSPLRLKGVVKPSRQTLGFLFDEKRAKVRN